MILFFMIICSFLIDLIKKFTQFVITDSLVRTISAIFSFPNVCIFLQYSWLKIIIVGFNQAWKLSNWQHQNIFIIISGVRVNCVWFLRKYAVIDLLFVCNIVIWTLTFPLSQGTDIMSSCQNYIIWYFWLSSLWFDWEGFTFR